jgi:hypothetical protein
MRGGSANEELPSSLLPSSLPPTPTNADDDIVGGVVI